MNLLILSGLCAAGYVVLRRSESTRNVALKLKRRIASAAHRAGDLLADTDIREPASSEPENEPIELRSSNGSRNKGPSRRHGNPMMHRPD